MIDIDRQLIQSFWLHKIALKKEPEIYCIIFYLRKLSRLRGQFCSAALVQSNILHKKCLLLTIPIFTVPIFAIPIFTIPIFTIPKNTIPNSEVYLKFTS